MAAAAIAAVAAAAVITVIAVALALFAAFRPLVGEAYSWAIVAAIFALVIALAGLIAAQGLRGSRPRRRGRRDEDEAQTITERLLDIASDRPLASLGAALAAAIAMGVTLTRSPKSTGAIAKAFFETFLGRSERR